jgi:hypothetical protein
MERIDCEAASGNLVHNPAPPNTRLQLTAFGARDRAYFEVIWCRAPRRRHCVLSSTISLESLGYEPTCVSWQRA